MISSHLQLRKLFFEFWQSKNHKEVPPIPLVPQNDPTTLFTGSGMQQLVPYLLGETHPLGKQLFNIQSCIRAQDIEEIGDNRHDTFFEMMGNWSLGTYFKKEQLTWFWEFLTQIIKLQKNNLYVSIFSGYKSIPLDQDTLNIWKNLGIPENRIFKYDASKNWWSRSGTPDEMPAGEPGGPTSEVFYEFVNVLHDPKYGEKCHPNCDCGRFMEIGNSVFMQYKKEEDGSLLPLPSNNVDFGGGLERILAAMNNNPDVFETDIFKNIIKQIEISSEKKYEEDNKSSMRIIADHLKTAVFLIKNGVYPSNKEQGYVLRRLLRRAMIKMRKLRGSLPSTNIFIEICKSVLVTYEKVYFNVNQDLKLIQPVIEDEINRFSKSLDNGLKEIQKLDPTKVTGKVAFDLYQNYGFPLEITDELLREKGEMIDVAEFRAEFQKHKELSRSASVGKFKGGLADQNEQTIKYHTATHLLHQALFDVIGNEIRQEGSNITGERLRFDFYSLKKPTSEEITKVQKIVNEKINESLPVTMKILPKIEAQKLGAKSFFREKYPDMVKVYFIGDYSKEFCGGPHVTNTKDIKKIEIFKFEKIGSNLYRIYAK
ncbi:MAG: alanine--tRNA ligase [bacterium]|nr:alanine--tRNA ligase [bacterium]